MAPGGLLYHLAKLVLPFCQKNWGGGLASWFRVSELRDFKLQGLTGVGDMPRAFREVAPAEVEVMTNVGT